MRLKIILSLTVLFLSVSAYSQTQVSDIRFTLHNGSVFDGDAEGSPFNPASPIRLAWKQRFNIHVSGRTANGEKVELKARYRFTKRQWASGVYDSSNRYAGLINVQVKALEVNAERYSAWAQNISGETAFPDWFSQSPALDYEIADEGIQFVGRAARQTRGVITINVVADGRYMASLKAVSSIYELFRGYGLSAADNEEAQGKVGDGLNPANLPSVANTVGANEFYNISLKIPRAQVGPLYRTLLRRLNSNGVPPTDDELFNSRTDRGPRTAAEYIRSNGWSGDPTTGIGGPGSIEAITAYQDVLKSVLNSNEFLELNGY